MKKILFLSVFFVFSFSLFLVNPNSASAISFATISLDTIDGADDRIPLDVSGTVISGVKPIINRDRDTGERTTTYNICYIQEPITYSVVNDDTGATVKSGNFSVSSTTLSPSGCSEESDISSDVCKQTKDFNTTITFGSGEGGAYTLTASALDCRGTKTDSESFITGGHDVPVTCTINSFTADNLNPDYNTGTTLIGDHNCASWSISLLSGGVSPSPNYGTQQVFSSSTGNLTTSHTYRLTAKTLYKTSTRDLTVTPKSPTIPTGLKGTAGACGTGTINISWSAVFGVTSYQLRDGTTQIYTGTGTSFSHTGLTAGSSHSYTVRATNSLGSSAWSSAVSAAAPSACVVNLPDLTASGVTPTTATRNVSRTFSADIINNGTAAASGTITHLFQFDEDADHEGNGVNATRTANTTATINASGGKVPASVSYTFASTGTKYIRVCADNNASFVGTVNEGSGEGNNCGGWTVVTVSPACVANQGNDCLSGANSCGQVNDGTIQCDGSCSAQTPPESSCGGGGSEECDNGASNPPECSTDGDGECLNGALNPPECSTDGDGECLNGALNPPECDIGIGNKGVCAATHYICSTGTSENQVNNFSFWAWTCAGASTTDSCQEFKKKPIYIEN